MKNPDPSQILFLGVKPLKTLFCLISLALFSSSTSHATASVANATAHEAPKPNIIFLMTDDQRWNQLGCYGNTEFETPHIDRLAAQGVIFGNAIQAVAICMPSRVSVLTGRHYSSHRVGFVAPNDYTLSQADFNYSYPALLKAAGYRTGFIGKVGFTVTEKATRPSTPAQHFYKENMRQVFDYFAGAETVENKKFEMWPAEDPGLQRIYQGEKQKGETRTIRAGKAILNFLDTQPENQPFCLSVSFYAVKHDSDSHVYMPHYERFKDKVFQAPENWVEGENEELPKVVKENARGVPLHKQRTSTPELYQRQVRRFATQAYTVDQQVGLMVEKLKEKGLLKNTIIIYTSDNGRLIGSHGLFDKCILYEESVKAPLIVFDGRNPVSTPGRREDALISSVDLAPTILSLAGIKAPSVSQGRDFTGILNQTQDRSQWHDAVLMEDLFLADLFRSRHDANVDQINQQLIDANKSYRSRGVRTDRWKYFIYYEHNPPIEELYDLERDPQEMNNLINNPEFTDVLERLRQRTEELYKTHSR
ncbi:sulfatase-like hydrolase/transferase [Pelagicoccus enzymogenes]|uniref:sulfatase-like hydrolase/transferase n=1 Tax=Pelagicoccus enzymogenes TaxID=2773457 RepID=UPI00280D42D4|nr:sulfatase-like hydrolase/transferase [Pelagicoccus enzymogenes]MDQ8197874.1 sulfatase-like hydrolase/transferase [Pelagicoccus enzymogenes]